ncbi:MAG: DUF4115 domain-containing protein [Woeseiaceae bacterium]|nr:DUF4115 domain-containing protein [Woeseiaceae bacterium]
MSDDNDTRAEREDSAPASGPLAGERLAEARRKQQITMLEVAKELHLDEPKVQALEQNKFEVLGAPVFAKGHLRKYAELVGVDGDEILADYYALNRSAGVPPVVGKVRKQARELSPGPWLAVIAILIVAAAAYWYFVVWQPQPAAAPPDTAPAETAPQPALPEPAEPRPAETGADPLPDDAISGQATTPAAEPAEPVEVTREPPPVPPGQVQLTMTFTGECWTEISDANGRRLFFDLGREGRVARISGEAPLSALFGNADNVRIEVNGEAFDIPAGSRRGQTARLTIAAR